MGQKKYSQEGLYVRLDFNVFILFVTQFFDESFLGIERAKLSMLAISLNIFQFCSFFGLKLSGSAHCVYSGLSIRVKIKYNKYETHPIGIETLVRAFVR